ncbi:hypothetical protein [Prauserella cavernicola]|uniref:Abortive infection protein n=1 Tax=Prauserella cavernicola TaxID=2800127 RepID=A0A934QYH5_9PSEU|nr:hypothetical protein [Prauserella cavernicola]MBK1787619.1 hypothetical protein [Prauserella cavernicola]
MLAVRGVSYLVGDPDGVRRDLEIIARDLHCTTVMLIADDAGALLGAAGQALDLGLDVYLRPDCTDLPQARVLEQLATVAEGAETLRRDRPGRVTLVVGSEFSHTVPGIVPGPRSFLRLKLVIRYHRLLRRRIDRELHRLLTRAAGTARNHFSGPITYSAAAWENIDHSLVDVVGVSLYRSGRNRAGYPERLRELVDSTTKPVVITEFGCGAFTGADARGAGSFTIVNWFADPPRIRGDHPRDESVQARYLTELIDLYDAEDVHGCFVFTFAMPGYPADSDPARDLDKAGFGLLLHHDDGTIRHKEAFHAVAARYRDLG